MNANAAFCVPFHSLLPAGLARVPSLRFTLLEGLPEEPALRFVLRLTQHGQQEGE